MANKKLTAVQELKRFAKLQMLIDVRSHHGAYQTIIDYCNTKLLELEQDQIENAYIQGFAECDATGMMDVHKYLKLVYGKEINLRSEQ